MKMHFLLRAILITLVAVLSGCQPAAPGDQDSTDIEAVKELYKNYKQEWLRNDPPTETRIFEYFVDNATLVPSGGAIVLNGKEEMKNFWFPENAPPFTVDVYDGEVLKLITSSGRAELVGRFNLQFSDETDIYFTEGYHLITAVQQNGTWKISSMIWTHPPWQKKEKD